MKISGLYGKKLTSAKGGREGVILAVALKDGSIERLICCDENEKKFSVIKENIITLCGDAKFFKASPVGKEENLLRLGKAVYTQKGKFLGYLEDCTLKGLKITDAVIGGKKTPFENLVIGDICILAEDASVSERAKDMFIGAICDATANR